MLPMASAAFDQVRQVGVAHLEAAHPVAQVVDQTVVVVVLGVEPLLDLPGQPGQRGAVVLAVLRSIDLGPEPRQATARGSPASTRTLVARHWWPVRWSR